MAATPLRNYRSSDEEHERAQRAAELKGEDLSTVIRRELAKYAARVEREATRREGGELVRRCIYTSDTAATARLVKLGGPVCSGPVRWRVDFTAAPSAFYCDGHREWHRAMSPFHDPFVEVEEASS